MSFSSDIEKFAKKAEKEAEKVFIGTSLALFTQVVKRTPVDTGRLKGNWQVTINRPANGEVENADTTPKGSISQQSVDNITTGTLKARLGNSIYLTNNMPYARVIEDGSSEQAPAGMLKITATEFQREIRKQARAPLKITIS